MIGDRSEVWSARAATISALLIIAQQVAGKAARDALFLSTHAASELPKIMMGAAVLSLAAAFAIAKLLGRFGPAKLVPPLYAISGVVYAVEWALYPIAPGPVAVALCLHLAAFGSAVISGFWSVVNERFDPHSAKRNFARISAGAALGGMLGGLGAAQLAAWFDPRDTLLALAALCFVAMIGVRAVGAPRERTAPAPVGSGLAVLAESSYLERIALMLCLAAVTSALLEYALKAVASASVPSGAPLLEWFASFYTVVGVLTFIIQFAIARRVLGAIGLAATLSIVPAAVILLGAGGALYPSFAVVVVIAGVEAVLSNSMFRSAYELLYTPIEAAKKRATKTIVDVGSSRLGDAIAGGVVMALVALSATASIAWVLAAAACTGAIALICAIGVRRGYVGALESSLKSGAIDLQDTELVDATTKKTVLATRSLDRRALLAEIEAMRGRDPSDTGSELGDRALDLLSADVDRAKRALSAPLDVRLVPLAIHWLGHATLHEDAAAAIAGTGARAIGAQVDALLDPLTPVAVRRRLPELIAAANDPRGVAGLMRGLEAESFDVAYACGRALAGASALESQRVFALAERALARTSHDGREVEHAFDLLSLVLERSVLDIARRALLAEDRALRGTALEYLENVLPESTLRAIVARFGTAERRAAPRSREAIVDELLRSSVAVPRPKGAGR